MLTSFQDPELWCPGGDCLVHLYAHGASRRGPAFRVPFDTVLRSDCSPLLERFLSKYTTNESSPTSANSDSPASFHFPTFPSTGRFELYIPAPAVATRCQVVRHHIRTRNFFAWLCEKPLVGASLSQALSDLLSTMNEWRRSGIDNAMDVLEFADEMGYNDLLNAPDHACAMLHLSTKIGDQSLWDEAFSHVVGMWEQCVECPGYETITRNTRSLIARAHYSLSLRLQHVSTSLSNFLDDSLSPTQICFSVTSREHLERFRDFMHTYWAQVLGYYPPNSDPSEKKQSDAAFDKPLLYQMRAQFQALYEFLVNTDFTANDVSPGAAMGGICVLQSVQAFDSSNCYKPLHYPLPHLPEKSKVPKAGYIGGSIRRLSPKKDKLYVDPRLESLSALNKASNVHRPELMESSLVKAFRSFESQSIFSEPKLKTKADDYKNDEVERRKVRWILVYGVLQTLITVTEVGEAVRDVDGLVDYFLCAAPPPLPGMSKQNSVSSNTKRTSLSHTPSSSSSGSEPDSFADSALSHDTHITEPSLCIEPDIDHVSISRRASQATVASSSSLKKTKSHRRSLSFNSIHSTRPLKIRTKSLPASTPNSAPSAFGPTTYIEPYLGQSSGKKGTVRRALSSLGNMPALQHPVPLKGGRPKSVGFAEILVDGYGNGLDLEEQRGWVAQEEKRFVERDAAGSESDTETEEDVKKADGEVEAENLDVVAPLVVEKPIKEKRESMVFVTVVEEVEEKEKEREREKERQIAKRFSVLSESGSINPISGKKEKPSFLDCLSNIKIM